MFGSVVSVRVVERVNALFVHVIPSADVAIMSDMATNKYKDCDHAIDVQSLNFIVRAVHVIPSVEVAQTDAPTATKTEFP